MSDASAVLSELREGCKLKAKRWSGDCGEMSLVNEPATDALLRHAADEIARLTTENEKLRAGLVQVVREAEGEGGLTAWDGSDIAEAVLREADANWRTKHMGKPKA